MKKQVNIYVDFKNIRGLFEQAQKKNRNSLFEYEVYELIRLSGGETIPRYLVLEKGERLNSEKLLAIPGKKVVIRAISPGPCLGRKRVARVPFRRSGRANPWEIHPGATSCRRDRAGISCLMQNMNLCSFFLPIVSPGFYWATF